MERLGLCFVGCRNTCLTRRVAIYGDVGKGSILAHENMP